MNQNIVNTTPYLRTTREYPFDNQNDLISEINKSYLDTAGAVNARTIGIFPTNRPAITGEAWFLTSQKQEVFRQVYAFGARTAVMGELNIPVNISNLTQFTRIYGTVVTTNGTGGLPDYRPIPYVDPGSLATSMTVLVGTVGGILQIRFVMGALAPPISSGTIVLEWMSQI